MHNDMHEKMFRPIFHVETFEKVLSEQKSQNMNIIYRIMKFNHAKNVFREQQNLCFSIYLQQLDTRKKLIQNRLNDFKILKLLIDVTCGI